MIIGQGILAGNGVSPVNGLSLSVLGEPDMLAASGLKADPYGPGYLELNFNLTNQTVAGPRHLVLSANGETEIAASALRLTTNPPPVITALTDNGDGTTTVQGTSIGVGTRIAFGGVAAAIQQAATGQLVVAPPAAPASTSVGVAALNGDGLSSTFFVPAGAPPAYTTAVAPAPSLTLSPSAAPAGSDVLFDLTGTNVNFAAANLQVGFGTSDVLVRNVWIRSPQHLLVQATVLPAAQQTSTTLTVSAGLQLIESPAALLITPATTAPVVVLSAAQASTVASGAPETALVLPVANLDAAASAEDFILLFDNGSGAATGRVVAQEDGELLILVPANLQPGALLIELAYRGTVLPPVAVTVLPPAPVVVGAADATTGAVILGSAPENAGGVVNLVVANLGFGLLPLDLSRVTVTCAGQAQTVIAISSPAAWNGYAQLRFQLDPQLNVPANGIVPLIVTVGGSSSAVFNLYMTVAPTITNLGGLAH